MGSDSPRPKRPTIQDTIIEMKMASKKMARQSVKSMKASQDYIKKAKAMLKKNNEEGAKINLQSAANKRLEAMNIQRMGLKMEFICGNMKSMQHNQVMVDTFSKMSNMLSYSNSPNFEMMSENLISFDKTMDEMLVNGKMMEEVMNNQNFMNTATEEDMLKALKGELAMESAQQVQETAQIHQNDVQFQEDLKKL